MGARFGFLGTSGAVPSAERDTTSLVFEADATLVPSFRRPDAFFEVEAGDSTCLITSPDGRELRCFVRTVLSVPTYGRIAELWNDPDQGAEPPLAGTLANAIPTYPSTLGLPGALRLRSPPLRPALTRSPSEHPFAVEANAGVPFERALEWRAWAVHS